MMPKTVTHAICAAGLLKNLRMGASSSAAPSSVFRCGPWPDGDFTRPVTPTSVVTMLSMMCVSCSEAAHFASDRVMSTAYPSAVADAACTPSSFASSAPSVSSAFSDAAPAAAAVRRWRQTCRSVRVPVAAAKTGNHRMWIRCVLVCPSRAEPVMKLFRSLRCMVMLQSEGSAALCLMRSRHRSRVIAPAGPSSSLVMIWSSWMAL
mmetsp:Transcript_16015/g.61025  ORF Transcript_16015/g.61025 Transcript_16015/m.61025 type:complete len:206 (+) Transcript_16015:1877-2494(+)